MTIRTGCSATLVALHEACQALERGECTSAIIGGANLIMAPGMTTAMTEQGVLSPDGSCKTFSADANGYARGEAINAIYIKPLRDALQDGNPIRAVIRSTATNSDGKTPGMSTPSAEAHEAMIRRAYDVAGISDLSQTAFVECHGTGTSTGDPLEVMAVGKVFGDSGVYIGSVKPNLGHSEGASGLTSIIKSVLALEHQVIPPNIKFAKPNPNIAFASNKLTVPTEPTTWPKERCERVSVNSFGIGGSNAHAIIDSARSCNVAGPSRRVSNEPQLLVYSANSPESLGRQVRNIHDFLEENPETRGDLAYTLANRREHLPHRAFTVASRDLSTFTSPLAKAGPFPEVVMVFTGQGAQWPQMGRELIESNAVFRNSIRSMDRDLQDAADAPQWSIEDELLKPAKMSQIHRAELSQPLCTAIQIALVDCLATVGIEASAVVGHSSGELAAAYASGGITAREAITAASHRGMVTKKQNRSGSMAAIGMSWEETERYLVSGVVVACENSPKSVTISGDVDKLESVLVEIRKSQPEVMARLLKVDQAYHSYHMVEIGDAYHQLIKYRVAGKEPTKLFFSSVTGNLLNGQRKLDARYWQKNLESPVLFRTAVANLLQHPIGQNAVFVEVGPHSALAAPLRQILVQAKSTAPYVPVMIRDKNCIESFLTAIGQLYLLYVSIDFKKLIPTGSTLTDLPPYPWNHEHSYWYESRLSKEIRHRKYPYHELLGIRVAESTDFEPSWRNLLHLNNIGWVRDHKIRDDVVFPFAGYVAMVGEAVKQLSGIEEGFSLGHVVVSAALVLDEGKPMEIITSLRRHRLTDSLDSQWWEFSIASHNGSIWMKHCSGRVKAQAESTDADPEPTLYPRRVEPRKWYRMMRRVGLNYGPQFQGLTNVTAATTRQVAAADAVDTVVNDKSNHHIHPTTIDFFLQLFSVAVTQGISRKLHKIVVPTNVEELHINRCYSDVHMTASATSSLKGAICGEGECIAYGKAVLRMRGVKLSPLDDSPPVDRSDTHPTARLEWRPDIDFLDLKQIFPSSIDRESYTPVLDELTRTCVLESKRCLEQSTTGLSHMRKFRAWLDSQSQTMSSEPLVDLGEGTAFDKINHLMGMLSNTPAAIAGIAMYKIVTNIADIYSGKVEPLEILLSEETLTRLYDFMDDAGNKSPFIQLLAHSKPNLRVLEIGAGTGASTNKILKDLSLPNGRVMYSRYAYTDISSGFFVAAKERFKALPNMEFVALDISRDPAAQGFVDGSYDLVVATNVLHATRSLKETLMNVRKLLHPRGRLLLQEVCTNSKWVNYIFGVLPGWWLGDGDGRKDEPYVSPKRWESELVGAGFEGLDAAIMDAKEPFQLNAVMVAKPKMPTMLTKNVTLLTDDEVRLSGPIIQILEERGCRISRCTLGESPPKGQDVLALLDIDKPFFENIDSARYESFKTFITSLSGGGILWITRPSQIRCADPRYAQTIGVARTIRSEMSIDFATCEIDDVTASWDQVAQIFNKFQMREQDVSPRADFEYAICEGTANVGRYHPFSMDDELQATESSDIMTLDIGSHGRLSTLFWSQQTPTELAGDEVQVETYAVGVNFRVRKPDV
jgi:acyl transferase domain-containing protein/SAM-dependent methyltransferase